MNRPFKISRAPGPPVSGAQEAAVSVPAKTAATFRFRTEVCEAHDTATATSCEECDRGMVDSICCVCNRVVPLDDDGYCRACLEPTDGLVFVERIAPGRIAC